MPLSVIHLSQVLSIGLDRSCGSSVLYFATSLEILIRECLKCLAELKANLPRNTTIVTVVKPAPDTPYPPTTTATNTRTPPRPVHPPTTTATNTRTPPRPVHPPTTTATNTRTPPRPVHPPNTTTTTTTGPKESVNNCSFSYHNNGFQSGELGAKNCNIKGTLSVQLPTNTQKNVKTIGIKVRHNKFKKSRVLSFWKSKMELFTINLDIPPNSNVKKNLPFTIVIPPEILKSIKIAPNQRMMEFELIAMLDGKEDASVLVPMYLHDLPKKVINSSWSTDLYRVFLDNHFSPNTNYGLIVITPRAQVNRLIVGIKEYYSLPNAPFQKRYIVRNIIDGSTFIKLNQRTAGTCTEVGSKVKESLFLIPSSNPMLYDFSKRSKIKVYHMIKVKIFLEGRDEIKLKRQCFVVP
ncbi:18225_t:CDS:2 [Acaulospora morrowiae]|uniref:18225_t:CDS:1 n=1 Tax=Acaulospora morrowiae TaxID=94023 RepID=A0A9N9HHY8_9GLOM|nr:18225_t:CDS:2 [Acaulospora morrowiae]